MVNNVRQFLTREMLNSALTREEYCLSGLDRRCRRARSETPKRERKRTRKSVTRLHNSRKFQDIADQPVAELLLHSSHSPDARTMNYSVTIVHSPIVTSDTTPQFDERTLSHTHTHKQRKETGECARRMFVVC